MSRRKRIQISSEQKERIIEESLKNGCDVKLLATKYQITAKTIGKWRSDYYKNAEQGKKSTKAEQNFVEVKLDDAIKKSYLKKVELLLDNHRCSIEGRLNSDQLIKLLRILEEASC